MGKKQIISIIYKLVQTAFIISLMFVVFPNRTNAETGNIYIECEENTLKSGQTAKCYIRCKNFNLNVSSFHGELTLSNNISFTAIAKDSIWEGSTDKGIIDLYTDINKTDNFNIASLSFRIPSSVNQFDITLDKITISDENFKEIKFSKVVKTININSGSRGEDTATNDQIADNSVSDNRVDDRIDSRQDAKIDDNSKKNSNHIYVPVILIVTCLGLVLLIKKGTNKHNK